MPATQDTERTYHVRIQMGDEPVRTKLTYTREQAKEITELVTESARRALAYDQIVPIKTEPDETHER